MTPSFETNIEQKIKAAIEHSIKDAAEPIIQEAMREIEAAMRKKVAAVAISVASAYSLRRAGTDLEITVRIDPKNNAITTP
jgi:hypothetical protein